MPSVRPLTEADLEAYSGIAAYAYNEPVERIRVFFDSPFASRRLGLFSEGRLLAALVEVPFEVWLDGRVVKAVGLAAIASAPETRRAGHVRELLAGHLRRVREEGVGLSLLYPFSFVFYERLGWSLAAQRVELRVPPAEFAAYGRSVGRIRQLLFAERDSFRPLGGESVESAIDTLDRVYRRAAVRFNLTARRTPEHWRNHVLSVDEGRRFVFVWEDDAGLVQGYVISRVGEDRDMTPLVTREILSLTPDGWRGLFFFLSCHDSQHKEIRLILPAGSPLLDLFGNPRLEKSKVSPGVMARIVDVKTLLEARGAPRERVCGTEESGRDDESAGSGLDGAGAGSSRADGADDLEPTAESGPKGSCLVRVHDRQAPWNDGTFVVEGGRGAVTARPVPPRDSADDTPKPDLDIDIGILSRVAVGARSLADVLAFGLAAGRPGPGLDFARRLFPARSIWHPESY